MTKVYPLALIGAYSLLAGCVNQTTVSQQQLKPVSSPCKKIDLLIQSSHQNFESMKTAQVKAKSTQTWKAKYNLVGDNCQIWTLGKNELTYSCRVDAVNKEQAITFYDNAKNITAKCLGDSWSALEEERVNDNGKKTLFTHNDEKTTISAHLVPSKVAFKEQWTVYYYIGGSK